MTIRGCETEFIGIVGDYMINSISWYDSYLDRINIEFDKCLIELTDYEEKYRVIICHKFSSIRYIGQYDENVIKSIRTTDNSALIQETKDRIQKSNLGDALPGLKQLEIVLIDGVSIEIVAGDFTIT